MRTMKLAAEDLSVGMFVAALDRPWLDSPFPFQGFPIKDLYELEQVRKHCRYVFVDVDRGLHADEHTPRRIPLAFKNARQRPPAGQSPTHPDVTENIGTMLRQPHFSRALPSVNRLRRRALIFMHRAIADLAKGKPINTPEANTILQELNEAVSINVNAALWLSLLRHEDEPAATHCVCTAVLALYR